MIVLPDPIPMNEFPFPQPGPDMFRLVCRNHTNQEYLTKHPYQRTLHYVSTHIWPECKCSFTDLVVTEIPDDFCIELERDGSCIHSDHMMKAGM